METSALSGSLDQEALRITGVVLCAVYAFDVAVAIFVARRLCQNAVQGRAEFQRGSAIDREVGQGSPKRNSSLKYEEKDIQELQQKLEAGELTRSQPKQQQQNPKHFETKKKGAHHHSSSLPAKVTTLCLVSSIAQICQWSIGSGFKQGLDATQKYILFMIIITYTLTMGTAFHTVSFFLVALRRIISVQTRKKVAKEKAILHRLIYFPGYLISLILGVLVLANVVCSLSLAMRILNCVHALQCLSVVVATKSVFSKAIKTISTAVAMHSGSAGGLNPAKYAQLKLLRKKLLVAGIFLMVSTGGVACIEISMSVTPLFNEKPHAMLWLLFIVGSAISVWNMLCYAMFWPSSSKKKRWQNHSPSTDGVSVVGSGVPKVDAYAIIGRQFNPFRKSSVVSLSQTDTYYLPGRNSIGSVLSVEGTIDIPEPIVKTNSKTKSSVSASSTQALNIP
mmetsp:Transcript_15346/g.29747  ORF Transcript_15346/g.29747 Transcript_15346/m.29747 type:complete len:450 (+) Transcript_15346:85-1434(+)